MAIKYKPLDYNVKIQFTDGKVTCCSQICTKASCPNYENCEDVKIKVEGR